MRLKGEPRTKSDKEWRWGTKGSFALYLEKGKFSDYENGVAALVGWVEPKAKIYAFE